MGIAHASTVLRLTNLAPSSKMILLVMALESDGKGRGRLTPAELSTATGLAGRTVRDHIPSLYRLRLLEKQPFDNEYQLTLPNLPDLHRG